MFHCFPLVLDFLPFSPPRNAPDVFKSLRICARLRQMEVGSRCGGLAERQISQKSLILVAADRHRDSFDQASRHKSYLNKDIHVSQSVRTETIAVSGDA